MLNVVNHNSIIYLLFQKGRSKKINILEIEM